MRVVLASDKFKGSLSSAEVAAALGRGLRRANPAVEVVVVPVADGGDGTLAAFQSAGFERHPVRVSGPTGERVNTAYARSGDVAVVELADCCGLARLGNGPAPLHASTYGLGEVIRTAVTSGCEEVVIGLGGSASTDGGSGMVAALGAMVLDSADEPVAPGGSGLLAAESLDLSALDKLMGGITVTVASDVDNPLLGPSGAAEEYGPQKGATSTDIELLERALTHWADLVVATTGRDHRDAPGAGAAGGVGFGALALLGARMRSGVETVLDLVGFDDALPGADLVVTGEGSVDEQSLRGKAPFGVLARARQEGVPVVLVCGRSTLPQAALAQAGVAGLRTLTDLEPDLQRCLGEAAVLLEEVGADLGRWTGPAAAVR